MSYVNQRDTGHERIYSYSLRLPYGVWRMTSLAPSLVPLPYGRLNRGPTWDEFDIWDDAFIQGRIPVPDYRASWKIVNCPLFH